MALDGKTPSEVCGITIQGNDKWKIIIQNASNLKRWIFKTQYKF